MGDIGHEFVLIFSRFAQFSGHIVQGIGQVAHFIIGCDRNVIIQISCCIFVGSCGDFLQRPVYGMRKQTKNHERTKQQDRKHDMDRTENGFFLINDHGHRKMNRYIPFGGQVFRDRNQCADHIFLKISMKSTCNIIV